MTIAVTSPAAGISIGDAQVAEGDRGSSKMTFTVTRSGPLDRAIRVDYRTLDGTATTGDRDYRSKSGSVRFRAGEASATIDVAVVGDQVPEPDESFSVQLGITDGGTIIDGIGVGTIVNDD